ncbi:alanine/glycine:cation symporter family protein [Fulvivirgaceae bacterium LMO-SS25]
MNIESYLSKVEQLFVDFGNAAWGTPLLVLLMGGGLFFLVYSRFLPFRYFTQAIKILTRKKKETDAPGDLSPFQALSTAVASTVGMGNISGVAVAITMGGPGAIFWMWMSAFVGMATNFFTCAAAVMFRGKDTDGKLQGGPMYVIVEGLGKKWKPLATFFCIAGLFGTLPVFQANQFTQLIRDAYVVPELGLENNFNTNLGIGLALTVVVSLVIFGGVKRIGAVAAKLVPLMVVIYFVSVMWIILTNYTQVPDALWMIIEDAFTGEAVLGGSVGAIILAGARRASFSNEAGIGTSPMAMGAVKSTEPIEDGLIAMLSPAIDTLIVCTLTALAILMAGNWQGSELDGVTLTMSAFDQAIPVYGKYILLLSATTFSLTTMFTYSYYGTKCTSFMFGAKNGHLYNYVYVGTIVLGAVASLSSMVGLIDGSFAMMAIPTMVSGILLAPRIWKASKEYFKRVDEHTA